MLESLVALKGKWQRQRVEQVDARLTQYETFQAMSVPKQLVELKGR